MAESKKVLSVIMGGGRGTRLFPLTKERCKPAVPLAGKYRLVDIPISNCLNSGCNRIFVLSQFLTASLHRHIQKSYQFDPFGGGFIDILSAEQTEKSNAWYEGTADAVRRNLVHFHRHGHDFILILSGDQLYRMDFGKIVDQQVTKNDVVHQLRSLRELTQMLNLDLFVHASEPAFGVCNRLSGRLVDGILQFAAGFTLHGRFPC